MKIAIEQLQLEELRDFLREQAFDAFPSLQDESCLTMLAEKWHAQAEFCTCRDDSQHLIGMIAFYANQPETGVAYIPHVYVSSPNRRKGLFSKMLDAVEYYVQSRGFSQIRLEVAKDNFSAQSAYLKNGFKLLKDACSTSLYMVKVSEEDGRRIDASCKRRLICRVQDLFRDKIK